MANWLIQTIESFCSRATPWQKKGSYQAISKKSPRNSTELLDGLPSKSAGKTNKTHNMSVDFCSSSGLKKGKAKKTGKSIGFPKISLPNINLLDILLFPVSPSSWQPSMESGYKGFNQQSSSLSYQIWQKMLEFEPALDERISRLNQYISPITVVLSPHLSKNLPPLPPLTRTSSIISATDEEESVDNDDKDENPPWHALIGKEGSVSKLEFLLATNPELIKARDEDNNSILQCSVKQGDVNAVTWLLTNKNKFNLNSDEFDLNIDEYDSRGDTLLHIAVRCQNPEMVQLLLKVGANAYLKNEDQETPLKLAVKGGNVKAAQCFLEYKRCFNLCLDVDEKNTLLHLAAHAKNPEMAELLLEAGADSFLQDEAQVTPLGIAVKNGNVEVIKCLLSDKNILSLNAGEGKAEKIKILAKLLPVASHEQKNVEIYLLLCDAQLKLMAPRSTVALSSLSSPRTNNKNEEPLISL